MGNDFFRILFPVQIIINSGIHREILNWIILQYLACNRMIIFVNQLPAAVKIFPTHINDCHKHIGMKSSGKYYFGKSLQSLAYIMQNLISHLISPELINQMKVFDIHHQQHISLMFFPIIFQGKQLSGQLFHRDHVPGIQRHCSCHLYFAAVAFLKCLVPVHLLICMFHQILHQIIMILIADFIAHCITDLMYRLHIICIHNLL